MFDHQQASTSGYTRADADRADRPDGASGASGDGADADRADADRPDRPDGAGVDRLRRLVGELAELCRDVSDPDRIDRIRALEEVKAACAAAQARDAADLDVSRRARHAEAGLPARRHGEGVGAEVALARRESAHRGGRHLGLAKALVHEMPHTLACLSAGRLSEWRATLLVRETAALSAADRHQVDRVIAGDPDRLERLGDRQLVAEARRLGYRFDPGSVLARSRRAEADRQVTCRPAPDTMAYLTALLPARAAVAALAALGQAVDPGARRAGTCVAGVS